MIESDADYWLRRWIQSERERDEAISALQGLWDYACTGASMSDVNTYEQPQFVEARRLLDRRTTDSV